MAEKTYSEDGQLFEHSDIQYAVDAVFNYPDVKIGATGSVYSGDPAKYKASDYVTDIIENMSDRAYDTLGEITDAWPNVSKDQEAELMTVIDLVVNTWADKHGLQPTFYGVKNVEEIKVKLISDDGDFEIIEDKR